MSESFAFTHLADRAAEVDCNVNIGGTGLAIVWALVTLAICVVAARVYTQACVTKHFGLSDYLMLCSIAVITGFASLISVQYHFGWGRHQSCITDLQELKTQIKFNVTSQSFGIMGSTFGRLSFIVFMIALFGSKRWVWWTLWATFVAQVVTNLGTVVVIYTQCKDPRALYDFTMDESLCLPSYVQTYLGWAHTAFNGACDAFLAILPTAMVWNLHMSTRLKIGLAMLLGMSAIALVGTVMKCVYLDALSYEGDYSYNTVPMFTWIVAEGTLVAIAASIPLLRPLVKHHTGTRRSKASNSYDLPRYGARSGKTDSSGFSRLGGLRPSGKGGVVVSTISSPRSAYVLRSLEGDDSDENILVLQQQYGQGGSAGRLHRSPAPEITGGQGTRNNLGGKIVVRQDYTVTSEAKDEGWALRETRSTGQGSLHERASSCQSLESAGEPRPPASVWSRE